MEYSNFAHTKEYCSSNWSPLQSSTPISTIATSGETLPSSSVIYPHNFLLPPSSYSMMLSNHLKMPILNDMTPMVPSLPQTNTHRKEAKPKQDYKTTFMKTHATYLYKQIRDLYIHTRVLDVYFLVGRQYIGAHFCILAYASPMLKNLLLEDTGDSMFISVPDVSSIALENLIYFVYNGCLKSHTINFDEVVEAAKYLGMSEVTSLLQKYYSYVVSKENNSNSLTSKLTEKQPVDDRPTEECGTKVDKMLQHNSSSERSSQPAAHCSSSVPPTGILSDLLSKPDNRSNPRLGNCQSSDVNRSTSPLNLSKNSCSRNSTTSPKQFNQSSYLGSAGSLTTSPYFNYFSSNLSNYVASMATTCPTTTTATYGQVGNAGCGSSSTKISTHSRNKSYKKDKYKQSAANTPSYRPSSQSPSTLYQNALIQGLMSMQRSPQWTSWYPIPNMANSAQPAIDFRELFPHLFSSASGEVIKASEQLHLPDRKPPAGVTVSPMTPPKQNQSALNLSFSAVPEPRQAHTARDSRSLEATLTMDKSADNAVEKKDVLKVRSSLQPPVPAHVYSSDEAPANVESSHIDNYTQTATSTLASASLINNSLAMPVLESTNRAHYEIFKGLHGLSLPLQLPSNTTGHQESIFKSHSADKVGPAPMDLSHISALPAVFGSALRPEGNNSESIEIDVVGSPFSQNDENSPSETSPRVDNAQLHSFAPEMKPNRDSKPATPESVEVIEESLPPELPPVVQRRPLHQSVNMGRKRKGCGECTGCQVSEDCGKCRFCRDKSKYGGPNRLKQVCEHKRCSDLHNESNDARKRRRLLNRKKTTKCGRCSGCGRETDCGECYSCLYNNEGPQPPSRKKICEMRTCEVQEESLLFAVAAEPSPYSTDSLLGVGIGGILNSDESDSKLKNKKEMRKKNPYRRDSPSKVRTKYYCGLCPGCTTSSPCGKCVYCEDMPKFGGRGRYRQKCIKQLCASHPRLQALRTSNRSKPVEEQLDEEIRQTNVFGSITDHNSSNGIVEPQPMEEFRSEQQNCDAPVNVRKNEEQYNFYNIIKSISDHNTSAPQPSRSDLGPHVATVAQLLLSQGSQLQPDVNSLQEPINKLHIKKCDQASPHWQIQSIPVKSDDLNEPDNSSVAMDLSSSGEEVTKMLTSHNTSEKDIMPEVSVQTGQDTLPEDNPVFDRNSCDSPVDQVDVKPSQEEPSNLIQDEVVPITEDPAVDHIDSDSSLSSSPMSPKVRGRGRPRGRARGRARGRGKSPVGMRGGSGRKRGRRRKTPRFTVDREDHSDFEDCYQFGSSYFFDDVIPPSHNNNSAASKNTLSSDSKSQEDKSHAMIAEGENSSIYDKSETPQLDYSPYVVDLRKPIASNFRPPLSTKKYPSPGSGSPESDNNCIGGGHPEVIESSPQNMTPSSMAGNCGSSNLVKPIKRIVQSSLSEENVVSFGVSSSDSSPTNYRAQSSHSLSAYCGSEKNSYNAHISCASTAPSDVNANVRDENENVSLTRV